MTLVIAGVSIICILVLLIECLIGRARKGQLSLLRLITVLASAILAVGISLAVVKILPDKLIALAQVDVPVQVIPAAKDVINAFAFPVVALLIYAVLKLLSLIVYAILSGKVKSSENYRNESANTQVRGLLAGLAIAAISSAFIILPSVKVAGLYKDYEDNKQYLSVFLDMSSGKNVSTSEMISAADGISDYLLNMNYISDDSKVELINFAVETVNTEIASQSSTMANFQLSTYDNIEDHKKQVEAVVEIAKVLDDTGLLDITNENSAETVTAEKVMEVISDEDTTREFVGALAKLDNGGEMLANVVNNTISEQTGGFVTEIVDTNKLKDLDKNGEALVQTLVLAECFSDLDADKIAAMSNEERRELRDKLVAIKSYGIVDEETCNVLLLALDLLMLAY